MKWFWGRWANVTGHLSFFKYALSARKMVSWNISSSSIDGSSGSSNGRESKNSSSDGEQPWSSPELVASLLSIAETQHYQTVQTMFDIPLRQFPDVLLISLTRIKPIWCRMKSYLVSIQSDAVSKCSCNYRWSNFY